MLLGPVAFAMDETPISSVSPSRSRSNRALQIERTLSVASTVVGHAQDKLFSRLARVIARLPILCIVLSLAVYLACVPGMALLNGSENMFGFIKIMTGFLEAFSFTATDEYQDYKRGTDVFPDTRSLVFIAKPLGGRSLVSSEVLRQIHRAEVQIHDTTRFESVDRHQLGFSDVCERLSSGSPCMAGSVIATLLGDDVAVRLSELEVLEQNVSTPANAAAALVVAAMSVQQRATLPLLVASPLPFPGLGASDLGIFANNFVFRVLQFLRNNQKMLTLLGLPGIQVQSRRVVSKPVALGQHCRHVHFHSNGHR